MKKLLIGCFAVMVPAIAGFAAGERTPAGGRSLAMGGTSVAVADQWSVCNNQAGLAWIGDVVAGLSFENKFLLKELMYEQFGIALPLKAGTFGFQAARFGNNQYSELKAGLTYARKIGKCFAAGIQLDYFRMHAGDDYGSKNLISCEIGLLYQAGEHVGIGIQVLNPVPVKITVNPPELLPSAICMGISYRFSEDFLAAAEAEKSLGYPASFRAGAEYQVGRTACARIGISTGPVSFTFGFGLKFGKFLLDIASAYHQSLGFSPSGSLTYTFK